MGQVSDEVLQSAKKTQTQGLLSENTALPVTLQFHLSASIRFTGNAEEEAAG